MKKLAIALAFGAGTSACTEGDRYTLYRDSITDRSMRVHVASFDTSEDDDYNRENCEVARGLFQSQPGVKNKFWCEKGAYKK